MSLNSVLQVPFRDVHDAQSRGRFFQLSLAEAVAPRSREDRLQADFAYIKEPEVIGKTNKSC